MWRQREHPRLFLYNDTQSGMSGQGSDWDTLRRRIRVLETSLDAKLGLYSGLATRVASGQSAAGSASGRLRRSVYGRYTVGGNAASSSASAGGRGGGGEDFVLSMDGSDDVAQQRAEEAAQVAEDESEIESLLAELSSAVGRIVESADDMRSASSVQAQAAIQRHREVLSDLESDYERLHRNLRDAQARRDLLGNVRSDIQYVAFPFLVSEHAADSSGQVISGGARARRYVHALARARAAR